MEQSKRIEQLLAISVLLLLCFAVFLVLRPFLSAILLALIVTISTWPVYQWIVRRLQGRRSLAAALITLTFLLAIVVPLALAIPSINTQIARAGDLIKSFSEEGLPIAPDWLGNTPIVGQTLVKRWNELANGGQESLAQIRPFAVRMIQWLLMLGAALGGAILELCLAILVSFIFYRDGSLLAKQLEAVLQRLAGTRAAELLSTAGLTLKGVVYGILGTALMQGILAWIGFAIAGVPSAALLGLITCPLALIPIGPPLVWIPATIWLFNTGDPGWGTFMIIWGLVVIGLSDNVIKPLIISRGSDLPLVLIFLGVIGGALQFGFLGVFIGPTLLALGYSLLKEWFEHAEDPTKA